jgi:hypothetical protein
MQRLRPSLLLEFQFKHPTTARESLWVLLVQELQSSAPGLKESLFPNPCPRFPILETLSANPYSGIPHRELLANNSCEGISIQDHCAEYYS